MKRRNAWIHPKMLVQAVRRTLGMPLLPPRPGIVWPGHENDRFVVLLPKGIAELR